MGSTTHTTTIKMKFTTATIAILATAVSAQSIAELTASIPACAQTRLATAIGNSGCGVDDNACQCGDANAAITREATPCVISGCSSEEALNTQSITSQICALFCHLHGLIHGFIHVKCCQLCCQLCLRGCHRNYIRTSRGHQRCFQGEGW